MRYTHTEIEREREKQAPCREPDMGFHPGTPGSGSWAEGGAKPLSPLGCPKEEYFIFTDV